MAGGVGGVIEVDGHDHKRIDGVETRVSAQPAPDSKAGLVFSRYMSGTDELAPAPDRAVPVPFAEHILGALLTAPGRNGSEGPGQVAADVIRLLLDHGADEAVRALLSPGPGAGAEFQVVTAPAASGWPTRQVLHPGSDVKAAIEALIPHDEAELVSIEDGARRTVMRVKGGRLAFVFPEGGPAEAPGSVLPGLDELSDAMKAAMADVVVELDVGAISEAVRQAVADLPAPADPAGLAEVVERAVAERFDPAAIHRAVKESIAEGFAAWDPDEIARRVGREVRDAIAPVLHPAPPAPAPEAFHVADATLIAAAERLHIQQEAFDDRVRAASRSLEALADELAARDRTAAELTDQIARSVESGINRLANRIDLLRQTMERRSDT
jgi:hypothetical protein